MSRVVHFEIHAADPQRAIGFYTSLFGWSFTSWGGPMEYWVIKTGEGPGIDGGMVRRKGGDPTDHGAVSAFVCTIDTQDIDAAFAKVITLGGKIALPKMPIPGIGWLFYAKDPEGNIFGVMQADAKAA